jgi:hypothetical protein
LTLPKAGILVAGGGELIGLEVLASEQLGRYVMVEIERELAGTGENSEFRVPPVAERKLTES